MRVLLVDDNRQDMAQYADEVRQLGHEVHHAHDLAELEKALERSDFGGAIIDLMFAPLRGIPPEETDCGYRAGVYLYSEVVAAKLPGLPFVVLTGVDDSTSTYKVAIRALGALRGFAGVFIKPIDPELVMAALCEAAANRGADR